MLINISAHSLDLFLLFLKSYQVFVRNNRIIPGLQDDIEKMKIGFGIVGYTQATYNKDAIDNLKETVEFLIKIKQPYLVEIAKVLDDKSVTVSGDQRNQLLQMAGHNNRQVFRQQLINLFHNRHISAKHLWEIHQIYLRGVHQFEASRKKTQVETPQQDYYSFFGASKKPEKESPQDKPKTGRQRLADMAKKYRSDKRFGF